MKNAERREENTPFEQTSLTISQVNQDISGNRTTHRTYCSIIKKVQHATSESEKEDNQQAIGKNVTGPSEDLSITRTGIQQKNKMPKRKYVQMTLFPGMN